MVLAVFDGGPKYLEIDHFNPNPKPRSKSKRNNDYSNLLACSRHCNGAKANTWPSIRQQSLGIRFLNPCEEQDYGEHIVEDPNTHELVGLTPAGRYHIEQIDLNSPHLVQKRSDRARIWELSDGYHVLRADTSATKDLAVIEAIAESLEREWKRSIPPIPYLLKKAPTASA